jgi:hypothetical protein
LICVQSTAVDRLSGCRKGRSYPCKIKKKIRLMRSHGGKLRARRVIWEAEDWFDFHNLVGLLRPQ